MSSESTIELVNGLVSKHPSLGPMLEEHLADNENEMLPYLFLADVVRWMVDVQHDRTAEVRQIIDSLDTAYVAGDLEQRNLIALGAIEMIPDPGEPGGELRALLSRRLAALDPR